MSKTRSGGGRWEDLRKEARALENEVDSKLVALSKLGLEFGSEFYGSSQDPLLPKDNGSKSTFIRGRIQDLESAINKLSGVNDSLAEVSSSGGARHTLQRHREILSDYKHEFRKTKSNLDGLLQREALLGSEDISGSNDSMALLMMENDSARNSERLIDEQINIALESRETLVNQRLAFKAMQTKLNDLSNRFPIINNLVHKINLRKKRDTIIIGAIIGLCLLFSIWYLFG